MRFDESVRLSVDDALVGIFIITSLDTSLENSPAIWGVYPMADFPRRLSLNELSVANVRHNHCWHIPQSQKAIAFAQSLRNKFNGVDTAPAAAPSVVSTPRRPRINSGTFLFGAK